MVTHLCYSAGMAPKKHDIKGNGKTPKNRPHLNRRGKHKGDYYLENDINAPEFRQQLNNIGLDLREIPADGNCLFGALSDQLTGTYANHLRIRHQAVDYIIDHRADFEPFFDGAYQITELRGLGVEGGQECIVAAARCFNVYIIIHQLHQSPWIAGTPDDASGVQPQLHIAYHNGEHYSSVRVFGDESNTPANIRISLDNGRLDSKLNGQVTSDGAKRCSSSGVGACISSRKGVLNSSVRGEPQQRLHGSGKKSRISMNATVPRRKDKNRPSLEIADEASIEFSIKSVSALHL
ncbi:unnamed protein product [Calicophoron daubneyi]|uniref:OTU domain-containing protein n=1 Tax=Calicophoron daubneyi TaxID=300641 RepID=A0AAV2TII0_CALDB